MTAVRRAPAAASRRHNECGAVAVEFALLLPVLMLIVFGIIQFGVVMAQSAALANGARTGARDGVVNIVAGHDCKYVVTRTREAAQSISMTASAVAVTVKRGPTEASATTVCSGEGAVGTLPCRTTSTADQNLYVTTTFTSPAIVPIVGLGDFDLTGTGAYRCEYK